MLQTVELRTSFIKQTANRSPQKKRSSNSYPCFQNIISIHKWIKLTLFNQICLQTFVFCLQFSLPYHVTISCNFLHCYFINILHWKTTSEEQAYKSFWPYSLLGLQIIGSRLIKSSAALSFCLEADLSSFHMSALIFNAPLCTSLSGLQLMCFIQSDPPSTDITLKIHLKGISEAWTRPTFR